MRVAMAVVPATDVNLKVASQIGVQDIVYYDMQTMPLTLEGLSREASRVQSYGLRLSVVECGPPIDAIVFGRSNREEQIEQFRRSLGHMGEVGVQVLCYTFMPPVSADAMVVRTSYTTAARGGALTTAFRMADVTPNSVPHREVPISVEAMWDNLEYFLRAIVPAAEAAGVKLAMHPDDPPLSPICSLNRIMSDVAAFDRLISISSSPVNGIALCQGCFLEMGQDPAAIAKRYGERINYMHFRDVTGNLEDFVETFPDDGPTDFPALFRALQRLGIRVPIRVDHVPRLAAETGDNDGYGFLGHVYATGYLKALIDSAYGKESVDAWRSIPPAERAEYYRAGNQGRR